MQFAQSFQSFIEAALGAAVHALGGFGLAGLRPIEVQKVGFEAAVALHEPVVLGEFLHEKCFRFRGGLMFVEEGCLQGREIRRIFSFQNQLFTVQAVLETVLAGFRLTFDSAGPGAEVGISAIGFEARFRDGARCGSACPREKRTQWRERRRPTGGARLSVMRAQRRDVVDGIETFPNSPFARVVA